ncbi:acylphosphatase [Vibrio sp. 10N.261.55.A7]|uniref:acylphosphatase n=1 Tax=Vibrio sp. 10N.261.55.A7 TaxID=1880851 RepID=UPI000C8505C2|nr:acylphosphatase [Vibrio sp. 10N.261.55.A7]PMK04903.1 acylphosphatase [Vibrio sp. 10N.261.55.A7]
MFQKCYKFTVSGRVQGVGFRYFTTMKANELKLKGYVKNLNNGDVEVVASGELDHVTALESWLDEGPRLSKVMKVMKEEVDPSSYSEFKIT